MDNVGLLATRLFLGTQTDSFLALFDTDYFPHRDLGGHASVSAHRHFSCCYPFLTPTCAHELCRRLDHIHGALLRQDHDADALPAAASAREWMA